MRERNLHNDGKILLNIFSSLINFIVSFAIFRTFPNLWSRHVSIKVKVKEDMYFATFTLKYNPSRNAL